MFYRTDNINCLCRYLNGKKKNESWKWKHIGCSWVESCFRGTVVTIQQLCFVRLGVCAINLPCSMCRLPDRHGQCGCGRAWREPTGWAVWGRGSANRWRWCVQSEGRRRVEAETQEGARPWWGRWAWGWTGPPLGCPCWPRSLSSKSLPLHRCSPSRCFGCRRDTATA